MSVSTKPSTIISTDRNEWVPGFTIQAELWNGRFAMLGFLAALITELASGQGILHFYNLMENVRVVSSI